MSGGGRCRRCSGGRGAGASLEKIYEAFGPEGSADRKKKSLRLDYGLLEFNLFGGSCESIAVQVHRLAGGVRDLIPALLLGSIEEIPRRISYEDVRREIESLFTDLSEEFRGRRSGYRCYRVGKSHSLLYVLEEASSDAEYLRGGDLWSIMISGAG